MTGQKHQNKWLQSVSILIIGLSVGWLAGLSASPVIAGVLSSLMGIASGVVVGLKTIGKHDPAAEGQKPAMNPINVLPTALLVLGIALAAPLGIMARTYHVFEPAAVRQAISEQIARTGQTSAQDRGVLFSASAKECAELFALTNFPNEAVFRDALAKSELPWAVKLEASIDDTIVLRKAVRSLCSDD